MKQYVVDELRLGDHLKLEAYLDKHFGPTEINGIYWIPLEKKILSAIQSDHGECQPFYFAIVLESTKLVCELLVRTREKMKCDCIHYATENQRNSIIGFIDSIFEKLDVIA